MRTRSSWIWCWITGAVLASSASAQVYVSLIDNLPTCIGNRNGRIISVSDATSDSDCSVGGATGDARFVHPCVCDTLNALGPYWKAVGGGAGGGSGDVVGPASATDNGIVRFDSTTGKLVQDGSKVTLSDVGDIQWEGTTADAFEGNFTFADPTADWTWAWGTDGTLTGAGGLILTGATNYPLKVTGSSGAISFLGGLDASNAGLWVGETSPADTNYAVLGDGTNLTINIPSAGGSLYFRRNDSTLLATLDTNALFLGSVPVLSRQKVVASTEGSGAPYAIPSSESGAVNTNEGSTAENYETLPAAVAGLQFTFVVQDTNGMRITAAAGDTIRPIAGTAASATGGFIRCATAGAYIRLIAINATEWVAVGSAGVWTIDI